MQLKLQKYILFMTELTSFQTRFDHWSVNKEPSQVTLDEIQNIDFMSYLHKDKSKSCNQTTRLLE